MTVTGEFQVAAVAQTAEVFKLPLAWTYLVVPPWTTLIANVVAAELELVAMDTGMVVAAAVPKVGVPGTLAREYLLAVELNEVSVESPFLALTL